MPHPSGGPWPSRYFEAPAILVVRSGAVVAGGTLPTSWPLPSNLLLRRPLS